MEEEKTGTDRPGRRVTPVVWAIVWRTGLAGVLVLLAVLGYGISGKDAAALRQFTEAVRRWQRDPDFRQVSIEYVHLSNAALRTHLVGIEAADVVMALRSIPMLPEHLRANDTSRAHYDDFASGPLAAYRRLTGEQGIEDNVGTIEELGRQGATLSDERVRAFLGMFRTEIPVMQDAGAVRSVRRLLADTQAGEKPFAIRKKIGPLLGQPIERAARARGFAADPRQMTAWQQALVLEELDEQVRQADVELWRTKQVNDFLAGIWAQTYGPMYVSVIDPILRVRAVARVGAPVMVVLLVGWQIARRRRGWTADSGTGPATPSPA